MYRGSETFINTIIIIINNILKGKSCIYITFTKAGVVYLMMNNV